MPNPVFSTQNIKVPTVTSVENVPALAKVQSVSVTTGQLATIQWTMKDPTGNPVDLTGAVPPGSVSAIIRESLVMDSNANPGVTITGSVVTASAGLVQFTLDANTVAFPGISICEVGILDMTGVLIFSNWFYLIIDRGQFGNQGVKMSGPPNIAEIRLHLRDSDPADNLWLAVNEFDGAELAACMIRPVAYFNEAPPPLNMLWNTSNFPSRYYYLEGIVACLYSMASLHYARTDLPYQQADGLMINDKAKADKYAALGKQRWDDYKDWVQKTKVAINASQAFQSAGSPYWGNIWWGS